MQLKMKHILRRPLVDTPLLVNWLLKFPTSIKVFIWKKNWFKHLQPIFIGVSGYPEKHMEAPSLDTDIQYLKEKIVAGADYIVTQMFFDNSKFFDFQRKSYAAGINVPIIPGLKPIATRRQLNLLPHRFHVDLPEALIQVADLQRQQSHQASGY